MRSVRTLQHLGLVLIALLTVAAGFGATATFVSPAPGEGVGPIGEAGDLIRLVQGQEHILWSSLAGTVQTHTVIGWPSAQGAVELGGAVMIEQPADGTVGIIDFGEPPRSIQFETSR